MELDKIKYSIYSTAWNICKYSFDYKDALNNWSIFADEIVISVGISEDNTYEALESYSKERGFPVKLIRTFFDFKADPFAYGKTENEALQNCTGDILIQQNLDERFFANKEKLNNLSKLLLENDIDAFWIPTIDLYGDKEKYLSINKKWYLHKRGFFRGPVNFGIKSDGRPNYNSTSTDELCTKEGNLVKAISLIDDYSIENIRYYVKNGYPISYHVGYLNFSDRLDRSIWWKNFWNMATNNDPNSHPTSIEEIANRQTKKHELPLWDVI